MFRLTDTLPVEKCDLPSHQGHDRLREGIEGTIGQKPQGPLRTRGYAHACTQAYTHTHTHTYPRLFIHTHTNRLCVWVSGTLGVEIHKASTWLGLRAMLHMTDKNRAEQQRPQHLPGCFPAVTQGHKPGPPSTNFWRGLSTVRAEKKEKVY